MYDFSELERYIDSLTGIGVGMADLKVMVDHKEVFHRGVGYSDAAQTKIMDGDDIMWLFSTSKVITCTAAMRLVDRGELSPDDTLDKYLPEYAEMTVKGADGTVRPAERKITIRDLFSMSAGFSYEPLHQLRCAFTAFHGGGESIESLKCWIPESLIELGQRDVLTVREFARAVAKLPLEFEPSTHYKYSICHDILGSVIEVVSGMTLGEYMKKYIFEPLGMNDTGFALPEEKMRWLAIGYDYINVTNTSKITRERNEYSLAPGFESGGAGILSTVNDYAKLTDTLACGGTSADGYYLMSPETVALMGTNQLTPTALADFCSEPRKYGYGWGYCGRVHIRPEVSLALSPAGEFGWDGAAATYCLVDAKNKVSAFFGTYVRGQNQYMYNKVHTHVRDLIYKAINK